jgi:hypothetical protein
MNYGWLRYAQNCVWLILPNALLNAVLIRRLPSAYQRDVWDDVPLWIRTGGNFTRTIVLLLPLLMRLNVGTLGQRVGLMLYLIGAVL